MTVVALGYFEVTVEWTVSRKESKSLSITRTP